MQLSRRLSLFFRPVQALLVVDGVMALEGRRTASDSHIYGGVIGMSKRSPCRVDAISVTDFYTYLIEFVPPSTKVINPLISYGAGTRRLSTN